MYDLAEFVLKTNTGQHINRKLVKKLLSYIYAIKYILKKQPELLFVASLHQHKYFFEYVFEQRGKSEICIYILGNDPLHFVACRKCNMP